MTLLGVTVQREDSCWEQRLRCVLKIFIMATNEGGKTSPTVVEYITLPCLKILHGLMRGSTQQLGKPDDKSDTPQATLTPFEGSSLSVDKWLSEVDGQTFEDWQKRSIRVVTKRPEWKKPEAKTVFLQEKYFKKWYDKTLRRQASLSFDMTSSSSW